VILKGPILDDIHGDNLETGELESFRNEIIGCDEGSMLINIPGLGSPYNILFIHSIEIHE
jgi:hypothetical protein